MRFTLDIQLGNDEMRTHEDVADVLHAVSTLVLLEQDAADILDANGNTVGEWAFRGSP